MNSIEIEAARQRLEAEDLIRQRAPARLQGPLLALLRPAIALTAARAADAEIPVGASKFGGVPDAPHGFEWPMWNEEPLDFLLQLNLEELAPLDIENRLPHNGMLLFFYFMPEHEWPQGDADQKEGWRTFYFPAQPLRRHPSPLPPLDFETASARFSFSVCPSIPDHPGTVSDTRTSISQWPGWSEFAEAFFPADPRSDASARPRHQVLGYCYSVQDDARYDAARNSARGTWHDWHLLLQLDDDEEVLNFAYQDSGAVYFLIHKDNLAAGNFADVWCIGQSH